MSLNSKSLSEIKWWENNVQSSLNVIQRDEPTVVMTTDASSTGWGYTMGDCHTGGLWTPQEAQNHINFLEMFALFLALNSFREQVNGHHVKIMVDNMTTVSDIKKMGTTKSDKRNYLVKEIWLWCIDHNVWITTSHIPGVDN